MTRRLEGVCLALLLATGCVGTRALCPDEGGRPWSEVRSKHFRIQTNMAPEAATSTALELEKYRRALLLAWGSDFDPPGTVDVILLRNQNELNEFTQGRAAGYATVTERGPLLVLGGNSYLLEGSPDLRLQTHELAHYLSRFVLMRQPRWLAEGLAQYLETVHIKVRTNEAVLGRANGWDLGYVRAHGWLDLEELWQWDQRNPLSAAESQQHYSSAWLWVHYLLNIHPERFEDFQTRLARAEDPRRAWEASFRGVQDLKGELTTYVRTGRYSILTLPLPPVPTEVDVRPLEAADAHALRALLYLRSPGERAVEQRLAEARREVAQGLKEGPANVNATILAMQLDEEPARQVEVARALVAAHPQDGRAWNLLAAQLAAKGEMKEVEQARKRAAELLPDDAGILNSLAWHYVQTHEPAKGLAAAQRAVALAPGDSAILDTHAALLFQLDRCPEALGLQQRAMDTLHENASDAMRQELYKRLQAYEAKCGGAAPAAAAKP
jgi:tetratricopeptide (TPR) repeat protein